MSDASTNASPARGILSLGAVQALRVSLGILTSLVAARWLGREAFGLVGFARGVAQVWSFVVALGAADLVTRRLAADAHDGVHSYIAARKLLLPTGILAVVAVTITGLALDPRGEVVLIVALAGINIVAAGHWMLDEAALLGLGCATRQLRGALIARITQAIALVVLVVSGCGPVGVLVSSLLGDTLHARFARAAVHESLPTSSDRAPIGLWAFAADARTYGLMLFAAAIYLQSDVLVVQAFFGEAEVGIYQGAALLILQFPILAAVVNRGLSPALTRAGNDPEAATHTLDLPARTLLAISVPVAVGGMLVASPLLDWMLGPEYAASRIPLLILLPLLPLRFLNNTAAVALTALGHQTDRTRAVLFAAGFNLVANLAVVPMYGAAGAASTTLATEILLMVAFRRALNVAGPSLRAWKPLARCLLACVPMTFVVVLTPGLHVSVRIAFGALTWLIAGVPLGAWRRDDLRRLLRA